VAVTESGSSVEGANTGEHGGRMPLRDHLAELRRRILISGAALLLFGAVGFVFYEEILTLFTDPFLDTVAALSEERTLDARINLTGVADPLTLAFKVAALTGLVLASPVWIYQLWAFVAPGLHAREKRWTFAVVGASAPLFLAGVALCYWVLPRGLSFLIDFTPADVSNYISFNEYVSFVIRLELVFGLAFLLPVFVLMLNAAGVLGGRRLAAARRWIVLGVFVFAAVATPTGDPVTMLLLAVPMWLLFEAAVLLAKLNDRRRARQSEEPDYDALDDDEASALP
jgi:sec-independent protein translocase protein TatC